MTPHDQCFRLGPPQAKLEKGPFAFLCFRGDNTDGQGGGGLRISIDDVTELPGKKSMHTQGKERLD